MEFAIFEYHLTKKKFNNLFPDLEDFFVKILYKKYFSRVERKKVIIKKKAKVFFRKKYELELLKYSCDLNLNII